MASALVSWLRNDTLLLVLIAIACYLLALLTSSLWVRWVLNQGLWSEINSSARYVAVDGIRGFLAFGVFVHHYMLMWLNLRHGSWAPPHNLQNELGRGSVAIFFMITAFLFWGRAHAKRGLELKNFFTSRVFRIYPLYLLFVSLLFLVVAYESNWTAREPASAIVKEAVKWSFFHMPIINRHQDMIFGGVAWTLLYEACFYVSLPLLAIVFLQERPPWRKALAGGAAAALFAFNHLSFSIASAFLGGIVAVYWSVDLNRVQLARGKTAAWVALLCLACVGLFVYDPFNVAGIGLLTVFFVVIASGNTLFGLLSLPGARWMGEISYSVYLGHGIMLWFIKHEVLTRIPNFHPSALWLAGAGFIITPLIILLASASFTLVERPFIAMGHRYGKGQLWLNRGQVLARGMAETG